MILRSVIVLTAFRLLVAGWLFVYLLQGLYLTREFVFILGMLILCLVLVLPNVLLVICFTFSCFGLFDFGVLLLL